MLTKFCGMYRVKLYHLRRNVKFVIMNSVFYTDKPLQEFYDLKGSIHGRNAKPGDQVLKDNDLRAQLPDGALALSPELRDRVRRQLIRDCNFLQKQGIMDYSMLVGIHLIPPRAKDFGGMDTSEKRANRASVRRPSFARRPTTSIPNNSDHSVGGDSISQHADFNASFSASRNENMRRSIHEMSDNLGPPMAVFDDDIFDEDDSSYLEGSTNRPPRTRFSPPNVMAYNSDIEQKKAQTIEQIYWPFHRLHDIYGHRRMIPGPCYHCQTSPCQCKGDSVLKGWGIPSFVAPLSDRKDGGFMMDTTGLDMPMKCHNNRTGEMNCEGKIFYMGVIDVLQEYNTRKVVESRYRMLQGMDALEASCVSPRDYAARFVKFFDMYSVRVGKSARGVLSSFKKSTRSSVRSVYKSTQMEQDLGALGVEVVMNSVKSKDFSQRSPGGSG
jgi:1-phosphatidylinositol-4-phosphate 5-kinase